MDYCCKEKKRKVKYFVHVRESMFMGINLFNYLGKKSGKIPLILTSKYFLLNSYVIFSKNDMLYASDATKNYTEISLQKSEKE